MSSAFESGSPMLMLKFMIMSMSILRLMLLMRWDTFRKGTHDRKKTSASARI